MNFQANQAKEPRLDAKLVIDHPVQGVIPVTNADSLFAAVRRPVSAAKDSMVFMTKSDVEVMLREDLRKAFLSSICLDPKPPYLSR